MKNGIRKTLYIQSIHLKILNTRTPRLGNINTLPGGIGAIINNTTSDRTDFKYSDEIERKPITNVSYRKR